MDCNVQPSTTALNAELSQGSQVKFYGNPKFNIQVFFLPQKSRATASPSIVTRPRTRALEQGRDLLRPHGQSDSLPVVAVDTSIVRGIVRRLR